MIPPVDTTKLPTDQLPVQVPAPAPEAIKDFKKEMLDEGPEGSMGA